MIESAYHPGNSYLHTFDVRAKMLLMVAFSGALFIPQPVELLAIFTVIAFLQAFPAAGFRNAFSPLKIILPLVILIVLLTPPFYREGEVLLSLNTVVLLTDTGLFRTLTLILRFTGITYAFFVFFRSTPLNQVVLGLRWYGVPAKGALIMSMSFRFIPLITNIYHRVTEAHKLRGSFETGMWGWARMKGMVPVLTSVLVKAVKSIPVISMSLEHRGFGRVNPRSVYHRLIGGRKYFTQFTFSVIMALIIITLPLVIV